ncbi:MAG: hypothetical protein ACM31E_00180 [Fibrobacterota bacterium]|nr:hypothetical protein [Chitinispirillaceae bacterium]
MMKKLLFFLLCVASLVLGSSEFNYYSDQNRELMLLPSSTALAGADLALNSGSGYYGSPSNLPYDTMNSLSLSYANYYQNTFSSSILSFTGPAGKDNGIGITFGYVYVPEIEDNRKSTVTANQKVIHQYEMKNGSDIFVRFGYGRAVDFRNAWAFSAGVAANARRTRLIEISGYGIGLDAGLKALHKKSNLSAVLQLDNMTTHYTYWSKNYREYAYPHLRLGLGFDRSLPYIYGRIRIGYASPDLLSNEGINYVKVESDTNQQDVEVLDHRSLSDDPELMITGGKIGLEYTIMNRLALRAGLTQGKVNFGAGLLLFSNRAGVDFAYTTHELAGTYQVSLLYRW